MKIILLITSVAYLFMYTSHFQTYGTNSLEYEFVSISKELQIVEVAESKDLHADIVETVLAITLFVLLLLAIIKTLNLVTSRYFLLAVFFQSNYFQSHSCSS